MTKLRRLKKDKFNRNGYQNKEFILPIKVSNKVIMSYAIKCKKSNITIKSYINNWKWLNEKNLELENTSSSSFNKLKLVMAFICIVDKIKAAYY
ncbi:hypothetical protein HYD75_02985 [Mycoplasmopsis bovis]|nr:hypothetical protein [Mycoplasmopsis bovis]QQH48967.1 hypothetical protein HYD75_02985 [Mycoplasmopsis bovis]